MKKNRRNSCGTICRFLGRWMLLVLMAVTVAAGSVSLSETETVQAASYKKIKLDDKEGRYIGLGVGRVMSMYEEFVDSVNIYNIDIETALLPLTLNPAKLLKLNNKGSIEKGKDADLVIMDKNLKITEVFARGKMMIENAQIKIKGTFEGV